MIKKIYNNIGIILLLLLTVPVILPYFHSGYFPTHDGEWAVVRLSDMFRSLRDHQFPVRVSGYLNFGYGYPLFNFTYPAPYYIGIILHFLKIGFVDSIKLLFASSVILSALSMYFLSKEIWKNKLSALAASIIYIYLPYRIVDLYARGSIGESLSFALFPLIIYCASKILDSKNTIINLIIGATSYALLILTHNIMALLFTPILILFIFTKIYLQKSKNFLNIILFILLSYGLAAFFWIPALVEKHYILLSKIPIADRSIYFVQLPQLILPKWGYGLPDHPDGFSYQIGLSQIGILILSVFFIIKNFLNKKANQEKKYIFLPFLFTALTFIMITFMFSFTKIIWANLPLLKEINYPWTLLAPIGFLISILTGFVWSQNKKTKYLIIFLCLVAITMVLPFSKPSNFINKGDAYYLTNDATTTSSNELTPLWVKKIPTESAKEKITYVKGQGSIKNLFHNSKSISFLSDSTDATLIQANTIYYPGWAVRIDNSPTSFTYDNELGLIQFKIPAGLHSVDLKFSETPLRFISNLISLITVIIIILLGIKAKLTFKNPHHEKNYK